MLIVQPSSLWTTALLTMLKNALSSRDSSPVIEAFSALKSRFISNFSERPLFIISVIIFRIRGHILTSFFLAGCISYSRDDMRFKSSTIFLIFMLWAVIRRAFDLFSSDKSGEADNDSEYPITIDRGVRMSCDTPAIQFERALSLESRAAFFLAILSDVSFIFFDISLKIPFSFRCTSFSSLKLLIPSVKVLSLLYKVLPNKSARKVDKIRFKTIIPKIL